MKIIIIQFTIFMACFLSSTTNAQDTIKFENEHLLFLRYVNPEACDYPYNLSFFYSYDEFMDLKFSGSVSAEELVATRIWNEQDYQEDSITYKETITIKFGMALHNIRNLISSSYECTAMYNYFNDSDENIDENWLMHKLEINYHTAELSYFYQPDVYGKSYRLEVSDPSSENVEFYRNLIIFYKNKNNESTQFSVSEE